jgi:hypothetical protein
MDSPWAKGERWPFRGRAASAQAFLVASSSEEQDRSNVVLREAICWSLFFTTREFSTPAHV